MNQTVQFQYQLFAEKQDCYDQEIDVERHFDQLMKRIQSTDWRKNLKKYINYYNLQIYKLQLMNPKSIRAIYSKLKQKYLKIQNQTDRIYWFQNELKIFVWLLISSDQSFGITLDSYTEQQILLISRPFFKINQNLCHYQYKLLMTMEFDEQWDHQENILLSDLVRKYNFNCSWTTISKELFLESNRNYLRTAHSCRQKWQNHLDSRLVKGNWTVEEDYIIIKNRVSLGKKWSQIAKIFGPVRTEHMIKNRFKVIVRRQTNKKQIKAIEEFDVCQQIQRKLLDRMNSMLNSANESSSTANSPSNCQSTCNFKDIIVKVEEANSVETKEKQTQTMPQEPQFVPNVPLSNVKVDEQDYQHLVFSPTFKYDNHIPMLVDQQYLHFSINPNFLEEPKLQFFF